MDSSTTLTIFVLSIICILYIVAALNRNRITPKSRTRIFNILEKLNEQIQSNETFARRDAIIKLDNLLSKSLQVRYKNDKSCGDNLKLAKNIFNKTQYQDIWDVHKLRNDIVHKDIDISVEDSIHAFKVYKMSITKILG